MLSNQGEFEVYRIEDRGYGRHRGGSCGHAGDQAAWCEGASYMIHVGTETVVRMYNRKARSKMLVRLCGASWATGVPTGVSAYPTRVLSSSATCRVPSAYRRCGVRATRGRNLWTQPTVYRRKVALLGVVVSRMAEHTPQMVSDEFGRTVSPSGKTLLRA